MNTILFDDLCKCEHCKKLFSFSVAINQDGLEHGLRCPECGRQICFVKSCGYADKKEVLKDRWIDSRGEWTNKRPTEAFTIGKFKVEDVCAFNGAMFGCAN